MQCYTITSLEICASIRTRPIKLLSSRSCALCVDVLYASSQLSYERPALDVKILLHD